MARARDGKEGEVENQNMKGQCQEMPRKGRREHEQERTRARDGKKGEAKKKQGLERTHAGKRWQKMGSREQEQERTTTRDGKKGEVENKDNKVQW